MSWWLLCGSVGRECRCVCVTLDDGKDDNHQALRRSLGQNFQRPHVRRMILAHVFFGFLSRDRPSSTISQERQSSNRLSTTPKGRDDVGEL